jgi:hypothetical protein
MSANSKRGRLPFEPRQNKKNKSKKVATSTAKESVQPKQTAKSDASLAAIPDVVSKRMARRMALFCGIPTGLGMSSFVIFYWLFSQELLELPPYVVLFVSISLFGLGFLGLSYGILSASWDENRVGSRLGIEEFQLNWGRTWKAISGGRADSKKAKEN